MRFLMLALSMLVSIHAGTQLYAESKTFPTQINIQNPNDSIQIPLSVLEYVTINTPLNCSLILQSHQRSITGQHFRYHQYADGFPINDARLDIHTNTDKEITLIQNQLVGDFYTENVGFNKEPYNETQSKFTWTKYANQWVLAEWKLTDANLGIHSLMYDGLILDQKTTKLFYQQPDTLVHAKVFLINPLQTAQRVYGTPYIDSLDLNVPEINAERKWAKMKVEFSNDTFRLRSKRYWFTEISPPITPETYSLTDTFDFLRSEPQFEDVNAFYHITTFSDYVEDLGFESALADTLVIDAHGYFGSDASSFNFGVSPLELEFGEGGVDDAEDGEVVIHEFSHAMSLMAAPETNKGVERLSMEEGNCDYFSVSYGRLYNDFGWKTIFDWDGHNPFFEGVLTGVQKIYPTDITRQTNSDRELWSSPLICIYEKLGRETTDSLVIEHLFYQTKQTTMPQMANIMLKIDTMLWQGKHYYDIKACFVEYGILKWGLGSLTDSELAVGINITNSSGFADGTGSLKIESNQTGQINVWATDMLGREVGHWNSSESVSISPNTFSTGIYQLRIEQNGVNLWYKIMKN